jgi:hypothetical protein
MIKLKNNFNYTKGFKTKKNMTIKRMRIKIEIPSKFYLLLNIEIEKKNQFNKRQKKRMRIKTEIKNTNKNFIYG